MQEPPAQRGQVSWPKSDLSPPGPSLHLGQRNPAVGDHSHHTAESTEPVLTVGVEKARCRTVPRIAVSLPNRLPAFLL